MFNDLEFIKDPNQWPNWPILPVKKPTGTWPICGIILALEEGHELKYTVLKLYMFGLSKDNFKEQIEQCEKFKYNSFEEMVADGWMVD